MIKEIQDKELRKIIKMEALTGKIGGKPFIPTEEFIDSEVKKRHKFPGSPIGSYSPIKKSSVSDPESFGKWLQDLIFDMDVLKKDIRSQRQLIQQMSDTSKIEYDSAHRLLTKIIDEANGIQSGTPLEEGISYTLFDTFTDRSKIDTIRTDAEIDTEAGTININPADQDIIDLSHNSGKNEKIDITSNFGDVTRRYNLPECPFSNLYNGSELDNWVYRVEVKRDVPITATFTVKIAEDNRAVKINKIRVATLASAVYKNPNSRGKLDSDNKEEKGDFGTIRIEWRGPGSDNIWTALPLAKQEYELSGTQEWILNWPSSRDGYVTDLRFFITKSEPIRDKALMYYDFSLSEISVFRTDYYAKSSFISKSMPIQTYSDEEVPAMSATISVEDEVPSDDTSIFYYVGLDEPVDGYWADENGNRLDTGSPNITQFIPQPGATGIYEFASDLRENAHLIGASGYADWEPNWNPITPIERSNDSIPEYVIFDNYIQYTEEMVNNLGVSDPAVWGDEDPTEWGTGDYYWGEYTSAGFYRPGIDGSGTMTVTPDVKVYNRDFYKIYLFPRDFDTVPGSINVSIRGKEIDTNVSGVLADPSDYMLWRYVEKSNFRMVDSEVNTEDDTSVISLVSSGTLRVNSIGAVEQNSARNLKHKGGQASFELNTDYYVTYAIDGDETKFDIDITPIQYLENERSADSREWEITYRYRETLPEQSAWITFLYNKTDHAIRFGLNKTYDESQFDGYKVEYLDEDERTERLPASTSIIELRPGWNKVFIYTGDRTNTDSIMGDILNPLDSDEWQNIISYVAPRMKEIHFSELTRQLDAESYAVFAQLSGTDGRKTIVVPSLHVANITESTFNFDSEDSNGDELTDEVARLNPYRDDAGLIRNFYALEYKRVKDKRKNRIIVKAILVSKKEGVTPRLGGYMLLLNDKARNAVTISNEKKLKQRGSGYAV